jgi:hypothetical protein
VTKKTSGRPRETTRSAGRWLLLIHHIPNDAPSFRVKVWRRLQRLGAVAVKNSVYVLPNRPACQEDFAWVVREVTQSGGEASLVEGQLIDGLTDVEVQHLFHVARDADYASLADEIRDAANQTTDIDGSTTQLGQRLRRRMSEIVAIDFFDAPGRQATEGLLIDLERKIEQGTKQSEPPAPSKPPSVRGKTWVTRRGVHVDRMASAWLIVRFIDSKAAFRFVPGQRHSPRADELRFDMFEAEFTHEGELCTFEVLAKRFHLTDPALQAIAEIVHDIDLKDAKFARPETAGVRALVAGIALGSPSDEDRIARASSLFDGLHDYFRRKRD